MFFHKKKCFFTNFGKNRHLTRHKNMKKKRWGFMPMEQKKMGFEASCGFDFI